MKTKKYRVHYFGGSVYGTTADSPNKATQIANAMKKAVNTTNIPIFNIGVSGVIFIFQKHLNALKKSTKPTNIDNNTYEAVKSVITPEPEESSLLVELEHIITSEINE